MPNTEEVKNELRLALEKKIKAAIIPKATHPALALLVQFGTPTTIVAKGLGVSQGTAAAYTNGIKDLPPKHIPAVYDLLTTALDVVVAVMHDIEETVFTTKGLWGSEEEFELDKAVDSFNRDMKSLFYSRVANKIIVRDIHQDGYRAMAQLVETASTLTEKWNEVKMENFDSATMKEK